MPQPCHIVRSTTVNDGSQQSRCAVHQGRRYSRSDVDGEADDHVRPYKTAIQLSKTRALRSVRPRDLVGVQRGGVSL